VNRDSQQSPLPALAVERLETEQVNPASAHIDRMSALEMVHVMNAEDAKVAAAVAVEAPRIAQAIEVIAARLRVGGRLINVGAGTSGRLGVLDAVECPPTFNVPPEMIVGRLAGDSSAWSVAVEEAEDRADLGVSDIAGLNVYADDVVVGVTASGRTPYVLGALSEARRRGAFTIGVACTADPALGDDARIVIAPVVGPEVIAGSTRLKAGTAQKMVLNMLSTGALVLLGKTYGNLMVDVQATNGKLRRRAVIIVARATGLDAEASEGLLAACDGEVKTAILCGRAGMEPESARDLLREHGGVLRAALEAVGHE
jgi:N-acetylmuramic acid 6-phosphate etherase